MTDFFPRTKAEHLLASPEDAGRVGDALYEGAKARATTDDPLLPWVVVYCEPPCVDPIFFACDATDLDHAEEQAANAYPTANILWASPTSDPEVAVSEYWESCDDWT